MFDLTNKRALITGASGGIGCAIAKTLWQQGASLALSGTNQARLQATLDELGDKKHNGQTAVMIIADLSNADGASELAKAANAQLGGVDILVNNAGATRDNLALRMKHEEWDEVINLDLSAAFRLTRELLKGMVKQRFGRIISISSVVGITGNPGQMNYAAAKAGLIGMSKSLAQELAPRGITANVIAPGFIETAMTDALNDAQKETLTSRIPLGRIGHVDDIAHGVVYLASNESGYMTGQTLHINGGMVMV